MMKRGNGNGHSRTSRSAAWADAAAVQEVVPVSRWRDPLTGHIMEEVEPIPNPPQEDVQRSSDGLRRKLAALLGTSPFSEEASRSREIVDGTGNGEDGYGDDGGENPLATGRHASQIEASYKKAHEVGAKLEQAGATSLSEQGETFDDRIHTLNVDALRLKASPTSTKLNALISHTRARGMDGAYGSGGVAAHVETISSILRDAGIVMGNSEGMQRAIEAGVQAAAEAPMWIRAGRRPLRGIRLDAAGTNAMAGDAAAALAAPEHVAGMVRSALTTFLMRAIGTGAGGAESMGNATAPLHAALALVDKTPAHTKSVGHFHGGSEMQSIRPAEESAAAALLRAEPALLGRALLAALTEFAPAQKGRPRITLSPAKQAALAAALGRVVLGRVDLGALASQGPQRNSQEQSSEARVHQIVLNTLALKVSEALTNSAASNLGDVSLAGPLAPHFAGIALEVPQVQDDVLKVTAARALLGALLGADAEAFSTRDVASQGGATATLRAGQAWGDALRRWARAASTEEGAPTVQWVDEVDLERLEARLLDALEEGVRVSERIARAAIGNGDSVHAPPSTHALPLSEKDRTFVARLLALNAANEDIQRMLRELPSTDAPQRLRSHLELTRTLMAAADDAVRADPEAVLRAWVRGESVEWSRGLAAAAETARGSGGETFSADRAQILKDALKAANDELRARTVRAIGSEDSVARSTSPRRSESDTKFIEGRR